MAKKSMILKQQAAPKFSSRRYNRCKLCGRKIPLSCLSPALNRGWGGAVFHCLTAPGTEKSSVPAQKYTHVRVCGPEKT